MTFRSTMSELCAHDEDSKFAQDSWSRTIHVLLPAFASVALFPLFCTSCLPYFFSCSSSSSQGLTRASWLQCHLIECWRRSADISR